MNDIGGIIFLWELVPELIQIANLLFTAYVIVRFLRLFLKRGITLAAAWASYSLVMLIMREIPAVIPAPAAYICGCGSLFAAMLFFEREKPLQKIFLAVTAYIVPWLVHEAVLIPWSALYNAVLFSDYVLERPYLNFGLFVVLDILYFALRLVLMWVMFRVFGRFYIYKNEELSVQELILMLLPVFTVIGGYWLASYYENIYTDEHHDNLWTVHAEYDWIMLVYQAVLFASLLASVYISQKLKRSRREEKENAVLSGQIEDIKRHIGKLEKVYGDVRLLRHDVKNHIMTLESLYKSGRAELAEEYAARLMESMDGAAPGISSGNPVTDIILEEKRAAAEESGIEFRCGFFFPENSAVNAFDVSVILGNALDNAIENADGENRFISVSSERKKNGYLITVENSFSGTFSPEDGLPETTKPDRGEHGFGLVNIRRVAEKYCGGIAFEAKDGRAGLTVLLMLERPEDGSR